jgi:hypothetical protein
MKDLLLLALPPYKDAEARDPFERCAIDALRTAGIALEKNEAFRLRRAPAFSAELGTIVLPRKLSGPDPAMNVDGASGLGQVRCTIPIDGVPVGCRVVRSIAGQDPLPAISKWVFTPATFNGEPYETDLVLPLRYPERPFTGDPRPAPRADPP